MRMRTLFAALALTSPALAGNTQQNPTWWDKFTYISQNGPDAFSAATLRPPIETTFSAWTTMSTSEAAKSR